VAAAPPIVETEAGPVTLLDLATLRGRLSSLQEEASNKRAQAQSLQHLAEDHWRALGALLLTSRGSWSPEPQQVELLRQAQGLRHRIDADDSELTTTHGESHKGIGALAGKIEDWNKRRGITADKAALEAQINPLLLQLGRQVENTQVGDMEVIRSQAISAETQAQGLLSEASAVAQAVNSMGDEVQRRTASEKELGFDALYTSAYFQAFGPPSALSPLILKRGEQAYLSVPATLARQQSRRQWVGGSQGFSFPIGHTGIRYRVGSFHGHPVSQQYLGRIDLGTLVVSNLRFAFIGRVKSTSVPLAKLLHVQCYSDALAMFIEGRENPDFYLVDQPRFALFVVNWFLNHAL